MSNKVRYGLENVHYAVVTENEDGSLAFGTPQPWKGAVSLTLEPQGDPIEFWADNEVYYEKSTNNGYTGTLETAKVPDDFRKEVLGEEEVDGVLYEKSDAETKKFALLFQFEGDIKATRHVLYYCTASRPSIGSSTQTNSTDVQTSSFSFTSRPRPDNKYVRAKATSEASEAVYDSWFDSVHEKAEQSS